MKSPKVRVLLSKECIPWKAFLRDKALARCSLTAARCCFRLTVDDYHRYCYVDSGQKSKITGCPVFIIRSIRRQRRFIRFIKENTRCYSFIDSENVGRILQMEVGALMVGKIINYEEAAQVTRGDEKDALNSAALQLWSRCQRGAA